MNRKVFIHSCKGLLNKFYTFVLLISGRCFYFSITKEENSDFDDNMAALVPNGQQLHTGLDVPKFLSTSPGGSTNEQGGGEDKIVINCTASTPLLGVKGLGEGLSPAMSSMGGASRDVSPCGSNIIPPTPSPGGGPAVAMQYLNQMAKPTESNLLLPPNLSMRRGKQLRFC